MTKEAVPYSEDVAQRILEQVEEGRTMSSICSDPGMPNRRSVHVWLRTKVEFAKLYELAKERQGDVYFDKVIDVAEGRLDKQILDAMKVKTTKDESPNSQRHMIVQLREQLIRAYQYAAAKRNPRNYGDKQQMEVVGNVSKTITNVTRIEIVAPQMVTKSGEPLVLDHEKPQLVDVKRA